jgi:hypothetical protein
LEVIFSVKLDFSARGFSEEGVCILLVISSMVDKQFGNIQFFAR